MSLQVLSSSEPLLSTRQRQVLKLIGEGCSVKEIAYMLKITYSAAAQHRTKLMQKLHVHRDAALVKYAIEHVDLANQSLDG